MFEKINYEINNHKNVISKFYNYISSSRNHNLLESKSVKIKYLYNSFVNSVNNQINMYTVKLNLSNKILASIDYNKIKNMGFSLIKKNNAIVNDIKQLEINDLINIDRKKLERAYFNSLEKIMTK